MRIPIKSFGESLLSRPAGREAALALQANMLRELGENEPIELDFDGVLVLTPSWADEFMSILKERYGKQLRVLPSENPSVKLTMETIGVTI